jgi:hypothetical protein
MSMTRNALLILVSVAACAPSSDMTADSSGATTASATPPSSSAPTDSASASRTLTFRGLSPITVGMTVDEASRAAGVTLTSRDAIPGSTCKYMRWPNGPAGVLLMALDNRIVRVDIVEPNIATAEGVRVGETAARVKELYAGRVVETPHKYTNGTYLTVNSVANSDSSYRLVFETDSGKVTRFRSGLLPAVEWVEGCS